MLQLGNEWRMKMVSFQNAQVLCGEMISSITSRENKGHERNKGSRRNDSLTRGAGPDGVYSIM